MTHTRYSRSNIVLLVAGTLVCIFIAFLAVMTAGFATDPVHDFRSFAAVCLLYLALLAVPVHLVMFRWSGVGSIGMWGITSSYFLLALLAGILPHLVGLLVLLAIEALICESIKSASRHEPQL
jgi:hypothetical protein